MILIREWYSPHFPELDKIVNYDNYMYAQASKIIEDKSKLSEEHVTILTEVLGDEDKARELVEAGQASMGNRSIQIYNKIKHGYVCSERKKCLCVLKVLTYHH